MGKPGRADKAFRDWSYNLKRWYGITPEQYQAMLDRQKGCCAICHYRPEEGGKRLSVDHSHASMHIRGLICSWCNDGLGRFKDSPSILRSAIKYLTRKLRYSKVNITRSTRGRAA